VDQKKFINTINFIVRFKYTRAWATCGTFTANHCTNEDDEFQNKTKMEYLKYIVSSVSCWTTKGWVPRRLKIVWKSFTSNFGKSRIFLSQIKAIQLDWKLSWMAIECLLKRRTW